MAKVLVTGGAGFIGAHLVARLVRAGDHVVVLDNMKRGSRESLAPFVSQGRVRLVEEDIRSFEIVAEVVRDCETVFHLAAQSNVMGSVEDADYNVTTNVVGTVNLLRAAAKGRVPRVVFASSREVYGDPQRLPVDEEHPLLAKNAYGASKVAGEAYCRTFATQSQKNADPLQVRIVRLANVYGPGDRGRVIPLWLEAARAGGDLPVYGGEQVIDFVWVGTVVDALVLAAETRLPGPVNIGSGVGTKIMDLARRVLAVTGAESAIVRTAAREMEVEKFVADVRLMRSLGLNPEGDPLAHLAELAAAASSPSPV